VSEFDLQRLGTIMEPEPGNPQEIEGVLNPAAARGPDGALYLFPRLVAKGNHSRIGIARVRFDDAGDPIAVERLGIALEPEADYEKQTDVSGGCEDPRITFLETCQRYIMSYTALSPRGPRIALAVSEDLFRWKRLGLATFGHCQGVDFGDVDDKDAGLFPVTIPNPSGHPELAILHRPLFPGTHAKETARQPASREPDLERESIWISYCPMAPEGHEHLFTSHHRLAAPVAPWELLKIGGGTPPVLTRHGWLIIYHGVHKIEGPNNESHPLCYSAGAMVLSKEHPQFIRYRSAEPVLRPVLPQECNGFVPNVVFPTGIDRRDDLGTPDRFDIYYGMADNRIGVARLDVPEVLPSGRIVDQMEGIEEPVNLGDFGKRANSLLPSQN
jgi:beta-1,2-mannobiose phosphorylase / 1,2-beta-oligomannan phosphorylase